MVSSNVQVYDRERVVRRAERSTDRLKKIEAFLWPL
jgi:hypothetical protein